MTDHTIIDTIDLPAGVAGFTDGRTIWLSPRLTPAGRRSTLAHEEAHIERGILPEGNPWADLKEEAAVDRLAARKLAPLNSVIAAIVWAGCDSRRGEIAEELDVDLPTLEVRFTTATEEERAEIIAALVEMGQVP